MSLLPSGLAGSGSQEEGASLTWTGGHTTGKGEREIHFYERIHSVYLCYTSSLITMHNSKHSGHCIIFM